ncbi:MAG: DUF222 domain-containing protein [Mycobacterium sp.]
MFDDLVAGTSGTSGGAALDAWTRVESAACARRVTVMVSMLDAVHAASGAVDRDQWCLDNWSAVCSHIGAAQRFTNGIASSMLLVGVALRDRLPKTLALFLDGLIDFRMVKAIVARSVNVADPEAQRALDCALAEALTSWGPMSVDRAEQAIDALVEEVDPHALRRTQARAKSRCLDVVIDDATGVAEMFGTLFAADALALDKRADAFAATVCPSDPRTKDQRRADAVGPLARGEERLACLCGLEDCPAGENAPTTGVVIYVVAHADTVSGPAPPAPEPPPLFPSLVSPPNPNVPTLWTRPTSPAHRNHRLPSRIPTLPKTSTPDSMALDPRCTANPTTS